MNVKMWGSITPHGFRFLVHLVSLMMVPPGIGSELNSLQQDSAPVPWAVGLVLGQKNKQAQGSCLALQAPCTRIWTASSPTEHHIPPKGRRERRRNSGDNSKQS